MKKTVLFIIFCACIFSTRAQDFNLLGVTVSTDPMGNKTYTTNVGTNCSGMWHANAMWANGTNPAIPATVNFNLSFTLDFWVKFDNRYGIAHGYSAADGIVAIFGENINTLSSVNNGGGYLGYYDVPGSGINTDFQNSLGVEFDIYDNWPIIGDPSPASGYSDHCMVATNADYTSVPPGGAPVQIDPFAGYVSDNIWRHVQIIWDCGKDSLKVFTASPGHPTLVPILGCKFIPTSTFASPYAVPWGFTGSTGAYCTTQQIRNPILTQGPCGDGDSTAIDTCVSIDTMFATYVGGDSAYCYYDFTAKVTPVAPFNKVVSYKWGGTCPVISATHPGPGLLDTWGAVPVCSGPGSNLSLEVTMEDSNTHMLCTKRIDKIFSCNGGFSPKPTALPTFERNMHLAIYPNPASGYLMVDGDNDLPGATYRITDIMGKQVLKGIIYSAQQQLQIELLPPGIYVFEITNTRNETSKIRFAKE